jgi:ELWxxDGT repeat protein
MERLEQRTPLAIDIDLLIDANRQTEASSLEQITLHEDSFYFVALEGTWGVYKSDGTVEGTQRLVTGFGTRPEELTVAGDRLFFTAVDATFGYELWTSDGTAAGTGVVKDIAQGPASSVPRGIATLGETAFFVTTDGRLWKSDGTESGTVSVKNISVIGADVRQMATLNGALYFFVGERTLWRTDGTADGTFVVVECDVDRFAQQRILPSLNEHFFFISRDRKLWKSNGSAAGTGSILTPKGETFSVAAIGDTLYSTQGDYLGGPISVWKGDGAKTPMTQLRQFPAGAEVRIFDGDGTVYVHSSDSGLWKVVNDGLVFVHSVRPLVSIGLDGNLYFSSFSSHIHNYGDLWTSDGTPGGTQKIISFGTPNFDTTLNQFFVFDEQVYFTGDDYLHGRELWQTDGTIAGTHMAVDVNTNTLPSRTTEYVESGGKVFLSVNDGANPEREAAPNGVGSELYVSDGTPAGTRLIKDLVPGPLGTNPRNLTDVNGTVFFTGVGGLWKTDGTAHGTAHIKSLDGGDAWPMSMTNVNGTAYFAWNDRIAGNELWKSDGTAAGTVLAHDIHPGGSSYPSNLTNVGGALYFSASRPNVPQGLWRSDETGTFLVADTGPVGFGGGLRLFTAAGDKLFFVKGEGELWATIATGATPVQRLGRITSMAFFDGLLYIISDSRIWTSDGTAEGTMRFSPHGSVRSLDVVGEHLFFLNGSEVWRTNGSLAFTQKLGELGQNAFVQDVFGSGSSFYIAARVASDSLDVWRANGESASLSLIGTFPWHHYYDFGGSAGAFSADDLLYIPLATREYGLEPAVIRAIANSPSVTHAVTFAGVQSQSGLVVRRNAADGSEVSHVKVTEITRGTLFLHDGVTKVNDGQFVSFEEALRGFTFTPDDGFVGTASFKVQTSTSASDAGLGGSAVTATITVLEGLGTAGNDILTLRVSTDGATLEVYSGDAPTPESAPLFVWPMDANVPLPIDTLAGDDKVFVELPAGSNGPAAGIRLERGAAPDELHVRTGRMRIGRGTTVVAQLTIAEGASIDIADNPLIVDYTGTSPVATLRERILSGRGGAGFGASWDGSGITSTNAANFNLAEPEARSIGYAENASLPLGAYTTFRGVAVDATSVLIAYTRTGDANLDGLVNDDDVTIVGANYAPGVLNASWAMGDFDYNGFVDDDDVTLLGAFYGPPAAAAFTLPSPDLPSAGARRGVLDAAVEWETFGLAGVRGRETRAQHATRAQQASALTLRSPVGTGVIANRDDEILLLAESFLAQAAGRSAGLGETGLPLRLAVSNVMEFWPA